MSIGAIFCYKNYKEEQKIRYSITRIILIQKYKIKLTIMGQ